MKKGDCNPVSGASWMMCKFLGAFLLLMGLNALLGYNGTVEMLMGLGDQMTGANEMLKPVVDLVAQLVAYTWPVVMTAIGASYLACYKKCWATMVFHVYLLIFILGHMWMGDTTGVAYVLLMVLYVNVMHALCGLGGECKKK